MDYERLGVFYLGQEVDRTSMEPKEGLLLYESADLTTHAVIVGMTGSGKTGLGIGLIEEAAIDGIPVLAIDPKGDLANLALTFPDLSAADFRPWVSEREAERRGVSVDEFAASEAEAWRAGLAASGQDGERIARLRAAADVTIYTPGSSAGIGISVLRSFAAPSAAVVADPDLLRDRLDATVTSVLTLMGQSADPLSPAHILLASILEDAWRAGRNLSIADLIASVQTPPFSRLGVMDVETVFPAKDRLKLAMSLNALLAAPTFEAWTRGEPLDIQSLLYGPDGKARVAVVSIAHLSDAERMFFVTLLLSELVAWTRSQSGTSALRALVYVDELFGYLPPVSEPPSKKPLLTLLKQARAFGVGLALATQNPVDLDYKALSNAGTWFVGRLQTERDKLRLADGLSGALAGAATAAELGDVIGRLPKRTFLMHDVHVKEPVVFRTRFVMSYLAGPLTREQVRKLGTETPAEAPTPVEPAALGMVATPAPLSATAHRPFLPPHVPQVFVPTRTAGAALGSDSIRYFPMALGVADVSYESKTHGVSLERRLQRFAELRTGVVPVDFADAEDADVALEALSGEPAPGTEFNELTDVDLTQAGVKRWTEAFERWVRVDGALTLLRHKELKLVATPDESEQAFRLRCSQALRERRDTALEKVEAKYASRLATLERRRLSNQQAVEREAQQQQARSVDTVLSIGTAILDAIGKRGRVSATKVSTAVRKGARSTQEGGVARARETLAHTEAEIATLQAELEREISTIAGSSVRPEELEFDEVTITPTARGIATRFVGVAWVPYRRSDDGRWSVRA